MPRCFLWMAIFMKSTSWVKITAWFWMAVCSCSSSVMPSLRRSLAENAFTPCLFRPSMIAVLTLSSA